MENCQDIWLLLSAKMDGELTPEEEKQLKAHLAECPECRALAEELEQTHAAFTQLEELTAPEGFAQGVMDRIRLETTKLEGESPKVIPLFRRPQIRALAGLAACVVLCLGIYQAGLLNRMPGDQANFQIVSAETTDQTEEQSRQVQTPLSLPEQSDQADTSAGEEPLTQEEYGVQAQPETSQSNQSEASAGGDQSRGMMPQAEGTDTAKIQTKANETTEGVQAAQSAQEGEGTNSYVGVTTTQQQPPPVQNEQPVSDQITPQEPVDSEEQPTSDHLQTSENEGQQEDGLTSQGSEENTAQVTLGQTADAVLTLTVLPEGAEEILGPETQWQTDEEGNRFCLITGAQMEQLITLAQQQGQDLTEAISNQMDEGGSCMLVLTGEEQAQLPLEEQPRE